MQARHGKYLLLDSHIVEHVDNLELVLGKVEKDKQNPLFGEDRPWEVRFDNLYPNIIFDEEENLYRCWYSPFIISPPEENTPPADRKTISYTQAGVYPREMAVCYATSVDGIEWTKPQLGLYDFRGSKANNITFRLPNTFNDNGVHGAGVFRDYHDPDSSRRYKMFFTDSQQMMSTSFSSDGIHWSQPVCCKDIQALGDTHNNAFWAPDLNRYIGITRLWDKENHGKDVRLVGHTESTDFVNWTKARIIFDGLNPERQIYSMPVFQYGNVYLGLIFVLSETTDLVHCELACSTDTINWHRICPGTDFIPLGSADTYDCGCIYAAATPVVLHDEIRLYYAGSNAPHTTWRNSFLCLARLRIDGFAGYQPKTGKKGTITTKPVECVGNSLRITSDIHHAGSVNVSILDDQSNTLATSQPIETDTTDATVEWDNADVLKSLKGKLIRLSFDLTDATLYSFSFTQQS